MRRLVTDTLLLGRTITTVSSKITHVLTGPLRALTSVRGILLTTLGGVGVSRALASFNETARVLDDMAKASARLGIGVEQLSSLKYTADLANLSFEQLVGGLENAQKNLGQFSVTGSGRAAESLKRLGIELRAAGGDVRKMADLLPEMADAFNAIPSAEERNFFVTKIFGDPQWVNLLKEGGAALRGFSEEAKRLNAIFSPEQVAIAEEYRDAIARVQSAWLGMKTRLLQEVGPAMTDFLNRFASGIAAVPEIAGNAMRKIRDAFGDGPEQAAARQALAEMFASWRGVAVAGIEGIGIVTLASTRAVVIALFGDLRARIGREAEALGYSAFADFEVGLKKRLSAWVGGKAVMDLQRQMMELKAEVGMFVGAVPRETFDATAALKSLREHFEGVNVAIDEARGLITTAGGLAFEKTDAVFGVVDALGKTALPELNRRLFEVHENTRLIASDWSKLHLGITQGWEEMLRQYRDLQSQGEELVRSISDSFTGNLSTAIVDAIGGVKSFEDAFRDMGSTVLRQIAEMTTQMLIFRAISGIAGSFTGFGASGAGQLPTSHMTAGGSFIEFGRGGVFDRFGELVRMAQGAVLSPAFAGMGRVVTRPEIFPMARGYGLRGEAGPEAIMPLRRGPGGELGVRASGGGGVHVEHLSIIVNGAGDPGAVAISLKRLLTNLSELVNADYGRKAQQREDLRRLMR